MVVFLTYMIVKPQSQDDPYFTYFRLECRELGEKEKSELKEKVLAEVGKWLERFDCIVIGPGLGRDPLLLVSPTYTSIT